MSKTKVPTTFGAQATGPKRLDTVLITGAVQSNFVRTAAAIARKVSMGCHIQLEERFPDPPGIYLHSGNVLLNRMLGATLHSFPEGENEEGAGRKLDEIADGLRVEGRKPYMPSISARNISLWARWVRYVVVAREILSQVSESGVEFNEIVVASGSGATHAFLLFGLRALSSATPVRGICVRRAKEFQQPHIVSHCEELTVLLGIENPVGEGDIDLCDEALAPGYGKINDSVAEAIKLTAHSEGIILDPSTLAG